MNGLKRKDAARFISLLLSVVLISVLLPVTVFARDSKFGETITWTGGYGDVTVTGYGEMWDFDVNGKHVESTEEYYTPRVWCDRGWDYTVGFSTQTEKITYIGNYVFSGYDSDRRITGNVDIPAAVKKIGDYAFYYNRITSLKFNSKLQEIGDFAFAENDCLTSLVLNKGIVTIGDDAFSNNTALTGDLTIPASVTEIGERAFKGCSAFTGQLQFEDGSELENIPEECFRNTGFDGILSLPDGLETIGTNAFTNCRIERIYIPRTVTYIADTAFDKCSFIKKIYYGGTSAEWANISTDVRGFTGVPVDYESKIKMCRVTFDSNGADPVGAVVVVAGDPVTAPVVSREGYTLDGWYDGNGKKWDFEKNTVNDDMTLTAKWTAIKEEYTVVFDSNGGKGVGNRTVTEGDKLAEPETSREGYTLDGWYDENGNKWNFDSDIVTRDMILTAIWIENEADPADPENPANPDGKIKTYTVTFEPQNGEEAKKVSVLPGKYAVLPEDPEWKTYRFNGWYTRENGYGTRFTAYTAVNSNMTLYASWSDNTGRVGYKKLVAKQKFDVSDFISLPNTASKKKYISSSKAVASVSSKGLVKTKKAGSAVITGQYIIGDSKDWSTVNNSIQIDVEKPVVTKKYIATALETISGNELYQGTSIPPSSWQSSKPNVAYVDSVTGEISILSAGTTKISVIWGEGKNAAKYKITIKVPKEL